MLSHKLRLRDICKNANKFFNNLNYLPLKEDMGLHFNKLKTIIHKNALRQVYTVYSGPSKLKSVVPKIILCNNKKSNFN